jgi:hypothetical protein
MNNTSSNKNTRGRVLTRLKKVYPGALFYISRSTTFNVVVYDLLQHAGTLHDNVANITTCDITTMKDTGNVSQVLVDKFFGFGEITQLKPGLYRTTVASLPGRKLILKFDKNGQTARILTAIGKSKVACLVCVELDMTLNAVNVYSFNAFTVHGTDMKTGDVVSECLPVTAEMKARYDVASIMRAYMLGQ